MTLPINLLLPQLQKVLYFPKYYKTQLSKIASSSLIISVTFYKCLTSSWFTVVTKDKQKTKKKEKLNSLEN